VTRVAIDDAPALTDIVSPGLRHLHIGRCPVQDFPAVTLAQARLDLRGWTRLRSIEGLSGDVTHLWLDGTGVRDLGPLRHLTQLRVLSLRGCAQLESLSVLADLPELRLVLLRGANKGRADAPKSARWTVSVAATPDVGRLSRRTPPGGTKLDARGRKLLTMLHDPDRAVQDQALELLHALGDAGPAGPLLEGTQVHADRVAPGPRFVGTGPKQPGLDHAVRGLLALRGTPEPALQRASWDLGGQPLDLGQLAVFPGLRRLELQRCPSLVGQGSGPAELEWGGVASVAGLWDAERVTLHSGPMRDLQGLGRVSALQLRRLAGLTSLRGLPPGLTSLWVVGSPGVPDCVGVSDLPQLAKLRLEGVRGLALDGLARLPVLRVLVAMGRTLPSLAPLNHVPSLRALQLQSGAPGELDLPRLTRLSVQGPSDWLARAHLPSLQDLRLLHHRGPLDALERFPHVRHLDLSYGVDVDLAPVSALPNLQTLSLQGCRGVRGLHLLARSPVQRVELDNSGVDPGDLPAGIST
jgi:Leucine-rich repeat (LRR) protein